jgi:hypothetical protein
MLKEKSDMKDMKFRIRDEQHSKDIQEALFKEGYVWGCDDFDGSPMHTEKGFLTAYPMWMKVYYLETEGCFIDHSNPEHFLLYGKIVTKEEYETAKKDWEGAEAVIFGDAVEVAAQPSQEPHVSPLRPRSVVNALRLREVIDAIQRYVYADKVVPEEWLDELRDLNYILDIEQQEKAKKPIAGKNESWQVD